MLTVSLMPFIFLLVKLFQISSTTPSLIFFSIIIMIAESDRRGKKNIYSKEKSNEKSYTVCFAHLCFGCALL